MNKNKENCKIKYQNQNYLYKICYKMIGRSKKNIYN